VVTTVIEAKPICKKYLEQVTYKNRKEVGVCQGMWEERMESGSVEGGLVNRKRVMKNVSE
jgi:hypothetical protein